MFIAKNNADEHCDSLALLFILCFVFCILFIAVELYSEHSGAHKYGVVTLDRLIA